MSQKKWFRRLAGAALVCASVLTVSAVGGPTPDVAVAAPANGAGGEFHALTPARILDTRPAPNNVNDVAPFGAKPTGTGLATTAEFTFNPLGKGGLPQPADADKVLAIVMTVTVTQPSNPGYLAVYPTGFQFGGANASSLLNFKAGADVPNLAVIGVGPDGTITFNANTDKAGTYHVIVDVFGWISTSEYSTRGSRLELVNPGRILDTRSTPNPAGAGVSMGPGTHLKLPIRGVDSVSPTQTDIVPDNANVKAVLLNLTLVNNNPTSTYTYVTATPTKATDKTKHTSVSLATPQSTYANTAVVPIGADGSIWLYNNLGELDLVVDVLGYFVEGKDAATNRGRVVPLEAPFRAFDTREPEFGNTPLGHGSSEQWSFADFVGSVTLNPDSSPVVGPPQQGLIGGLVAINLQKTWPEDPAWSESYLQMYPGGLSQRPVTSNLNMFLGKDVANMSVVRYGSKDGASHIVEAFNNYGSIHYLLDVYAIVLDD